MLTLNKVSPFILGFDGTEITPDTRCTIKALRPAGFIVFGRNISSRAQLKSLCAYLKSLSPLQNPLIFIDQEGGRVRRIAWDDFYKAPPAREIGKIFERDPQKGLAAAQWNAYLVSRELRELGVSINCMPVADLLIKGAHSIIGDRAFSHDPQVVGALCAASIKGCMAGGIWPVIKHAPGHGRAQTDSHEELPAVSAPAEDLEADFTPFRMNSECPFVMTAHVKYTALDNACATVSNKVIESTLRGDLAMSGTIVADDMFMHALEGSLEERIASSLGAGCDLVICGSSSIDGRFSADMWQQVKALEAKFSISGDARQRLACLPELPEKFDISREEALSELNKLMVV